MPDNNSYVLYMVAKDEVCSHGHSFIGVATKGDTEDDRLRLQFSVGLTSNGQLVEHHAYSSQFEQTFYYKATKVTPEQLTKLMQIINQDRHAYGNESRIHKEHQYTLGLLSDSKDNELKPNVVYIGLSDDGAIEYKVLSKKKNDRKTVHFGKIGQTEINQHINSKWHPILDDKQNEIIEALSNDKGIDHHYLDHILYFTTPQGHTPKKTSIPRGPGFSLRKNCKTYTVNLLKEAGISNLGIYKNPLVDLPLSQADKLEEVIILKTKKEGGDTNRNVYTLYPEGTKEYSITRLSHYITKREKEKNYTGGLFKWFGYNKKIKLQAAQLVKSHIENNTQLTLDELSQYQKVMEQGRLGKLFHQINKHDSTNIFPIVNRQHTSTYRH